MPERQFGRYLLKEEIERGGMATVFLAYDPKVDREVAIKVLPKEFLSDKTSHKRFQQEAETIARLDHPNIVPVYDYGEYDGQPYLVMRLMKGGNLKERLLQGAIPVEEALSILQSIAAALEKAHTNGIVHRDLKPDNILFDQFNTPFLSDFGIAKLAETQHTLTGTGLMGTPQYSSPEQAHGDEMVDGRADIYALGIILFEMLTGELPYKADTPVQWMMKHLTEPMPNILTYNPSLPRGTQQVIARATAKKPADRYQTAVSFTEAAIQLGDSPSPDKKMLSSRTVRLLIGLLIVFLIIGGWWIIGKNKSNTTSMPTAPIAVVMAEIATETVSPVSTPLPITSRPTSTIAPTFTNTPLPSPTSTPTNTPQPTIPPTPTAAIISANNINQLAETKLFVSESIIHDFAVNADDSIMAVASNFSVRLYDTANMTLLREWENQADYRGDIAWSPDGSLLALSGSHDGLRVWENSNSSQTRQLISGENSIWELTWSPDSQFLAVADFGSTIRLWEKGDWKNSVHLEGHSQRVTALSWSPNGILLASSSNDNTVRIWNLDGEEIHLFTGHETNITSLIWSADSSLLLSTDEDQVAYIWDIQQNQSAYNSPNVTDAFWLNDSGQLALLSDGKIDIRSIETWDTASPIIDYSDAMNKAYLSPIELLATTGSDEYIKVWDTTIQQRRHLLRGHDTTILDMSWSSDGKRLASVSDDAFKVWNVANGALLIEEAGYGRIQKFDWILDDSKLLTLAQGGHFLHLWDVTSATRTASIGHAQNDTIKVIEWFPDGVRLAMLDNQNVVWILNTQTGMIEQELFDEETESSRYTSFDTSDITISPDGTQLASSGGDNIINVWDVSNGNVLMTFTGQNPEMRAMAWSPDSTILAAVSSLRSSRTGGLLYLWNVSTDEEIRVSTNYTAGASDMIWSDDSEQLAISGYSPSGSVFIVDVETGEVLRWLGGHAHFSDIDIDWSPDSTRLASAGQQSSGEGKIIIWNATIWDPFSSQQLSSIETHEMGALNIAWSADSSLLFSLGDYGNLRIWHVTSSEELRTIEGYASRNVWGQRGENLAFSPDGKQLAVVADNNIIYIFEIVP